LGNPKVDLGIHWKHHQNISRHGRCLEMHAHSTKRRLYSLKSTNFLAQSIQFTCRIISGYQKKIRPLLFF
jgi:hypothetical protein